MGKYVFYIIIVFVIAFAANYFGFVRIPWLDVPGASSVYHQKVDGYKNKVDDQIAPK